MINLSLNSKKCSLGIIILLLISCSVSNRKEDSNRCSRTYTNDFKRIVFEKFDTSITNDSLRLNEVRFECINTSFAVKKVLYDKYGMWDKAIYLKNKKHPILIWNYRKLIKDQKGQYQIAAYGAEERKTIYASAMVVNESGEDMLLSTSNTRTEIIETLSELIKTNNNTKRDFYEVYWKEVDPSAWERIKKLK